MADRYKNIEVKNYFYLKSINTIFLLTKTIFFSVSPSLGEKHKKLFNICNKCTFER